MKKKQEQVIMFDLFGYYPPMDVDLKKSVDKAISELRGKSRKKANKMGYVNMKNVY